MILFKKISHVCCWHINTTFCLLWSSDQRKKKITIKKKKSNQNNKKQCILTETSSKHSWEIILNKDEIGSLGLAQNTPIFLQGFLKIILLGQTKDILTLGFVDPDIPKGN